MPKKGCIENPPKLPGHIDIYNIYFLKTKKDKTIKYLFHV